MSAVDPRIVPALEYQRAAVGKASLASPLYDALLGAAIADVGSGGPCALVLSQMPAGLDPIPDAVVLRFLGALHRLVLEGGAPSLARWFPTAGGAFDPAIDGPAARHDFLAAVEAHAGELADGLRQGVQTNEVGRCAALVVGFSEVLRTFGLPLRLLELGASAGLNLRWDRWRYESGATAWGDEAAPIRFVTAPAAAGRTAGDASQVGSTAGVAPTAAGSTSVAYRTPAPDVSAPLGPGEAVVERRGCDRAPIDAATDAGRRLLRSFVWPDQAARHERLDAALAAAAAVPAPIDAEDAAPWVARQLAEPVPGVATVVFHSIVWQYLPQPTRDGVRAAIVAASHRATADAPIAWLRMEPGEDPSEAAEIRLITAPGGEHRLLANTGYHGHPVWVP